MSKRDEPHGFQHLVVTLERFLPGQDMAGQLQCSPLNYWCPPVTAYTIVPFGRQSVKVDLGHGDGSLEMMLK